MWLFYHSIWHKVHVLILQQLSQLNKEFVQQHCFRNFFLMCVCCGLVAWLNDPQMDRQMDRQTGGQTDKQTDWLMDWLNDSLTSWMTNWLNCRMTELLTSLPMYSTDNNYCRYVIVCIYMCAYGAVRLINYNETEHLFDLVTVFWII